ncbi:MAG: DUF3854 domain-containing protein [Dehalococcoidia bacterium]|nr:DUF3854 domain-containing protein [Dehalococcoidia bacterium]
MNSIGDPGDPFCKEIPGLLQRHFDHLLSSAITIDVMKERGYQSILGEAQLKELGFTKGQRRVPGLLMPIWSPNGKVGNHQFRPDHPRIDKGKPVKYEIPKGSRICLDVPPTCRSLVTDPSIPLWVTEGIKKGDSLASHGVCSISLLGVWGFVGKNIQGGITTLPEWRDIALNSRLVYVAYDSDVVLKRPVQQALDALIAWLRHRGVEDVLVVHLPSPHGLKVGIDDFLSSHTITDAIALARRPEDCRPLGGGYRVEDGRICKVIVDHEGTERLKPLCNFVAKVSEDLKRDDGIDPEHYFVIEGELAGGRRLPPVQIPASSFGTLNWVVPSWGIDAVVAAGQTVKDSLREAIQLMSSGASERTVYTHTGWRKIDGIWRFLSAEAPDLDVQLPEALSLYRLPSSGGGHQEAVAASLRFMDIASYEITVPLLAAVYYAPLCEVTPPNFILFLCGRTGSLKTSLACLGASHYGGPFSRSSVPANFEWTDNSLERLQSQAKDVLLIVDDYYPQPTEAKAKQQEQVLQRMIRGQAGRGARGRLRSDTSMRHLYLPRGLVVVTGEVLPTGHSTAARIIVIDMSKDKVDMNKLSQAQAEAKLYPAAMRSYVDWLSPHLDNLKRALPQDFKKLRDHLRGDYTHLNVAEMVAQLCMGWDLMLQHASSIGAIDAAKRDQLLISGFELLKTVGKSQEKKISAQRPTLRFIHILSELLSRKRIYFRHRRTNREPDDCELWGWINTEVRGRTLADPGPNAEFLGWVDTDEEMMYALSEITYKVVVQFAREQGEHFTTTKHALYEQLRDEKILIPVNNDNIVTKTIHGHSHRVIQLCLRAFE